jgi:ergothioneine biosynthesis protein EgtB
MMNSEKILDRFNQIRSYSENLCRPLKTEDYVAQPIMETSPPKWNLGHTTWFFETFILKKHKGHYQLYNEDYPLLFNSYYNFEGERISRHERGDLTRPTVKEVYAYRSFVNQEMIAFIQAGINSEIEALIELGLQHEQQHHELFWADLKYTFGLNPLFPKYEGKFPFNDHTYFTEEMAFIKMNEGIYEIGHKNDGFCYDNELGVHKVYLHEYQIADRPVTNAEYLEFMNDGGYQNFDLWHDEAWQWVKQERISAPLYWHKIDGKWMYYSLTGLQPVNPNQLVTHISYYEAFAYARWKGMRLPTEFEWEAASSKFEWGKRWEWTESAYLPYPGYKRAEGAVGEYNGKFMVNQKVLRGASLYTSPGHSRYTYRNFFHPWVRWQFSGIRLIN